MHILIISIGILVILRFIGKFSIPTKGLLAIATYCIFSLIIFDFGYEVPFNLGDSQKLIEVYHAISIFILIAGSFHLGEVISNTVEYEKSGNTHSHLRGLFSSNQSIRTQITTILIALSSVSFLFVAVDPSKLMFRQGYIVELDLQDAMKFADLTLWLSTILTPLIKNRFIRWFVLILTASGFLGLGSRSAIVYLVGYVSIRYLLLDFKIVKAAIGLSVVLFIGAGVLDIRSETNQGLYPFIIKLLAFNINFDTLFIFVNYLTTYSLFLFIDHEYSYVYNIQYFLLSINPLPGFMFNIEGLDAWARFRKSIPYPAIAQIYGHVGIIGLFFSFFILGCIKSIVLRLFSKKNGSQKIVGSTKAKLFEVVLFLPILVSMQYNLRTSSRMLYLIVGLAMIYALLSKKLKIKEK